MSEKLILILHSQIEWEVIVVDDNSPDGTQEIAKQLAKVYGEDKIVSKKYCILCSSWCV